MHRNHVMIRNQALAGNGCLAEWPNGTSMPAAVTLDRSPAHTHRSDETSIEADKKNETRVQRLLKLIEVMRSGQVFGPEELAKQTGVSRRTVFRDINLLARAGVPVRYDSNRRGYLISRSYFLPSTGLSLFEAASLHIAAMKMAGSRIYPLFAEATAALGKMVQGVSPGLWGPCSQMARVVETRWPAMVDTSPTRDIFQSLLAAASERRKVLVQCDSRAGQPKLKIVLQPYVLALLGHTWYVIGYCEEYQEVRAVALDLVLSAEPMAETFAEPSGFSLDGYLGQAWTLSREGFIASVRLRFSPKVSDRVGDIIWHCTQRTQRQPDGSLIFEVDVDGLTEISHWILGYGDEVVVEEPIELRTRIQQMAQNIAKRYAS